MSDSLEPEFPMPPQMQQALSHSMLVERVDFSPGMQHGPRRGQPSTVAVLIGRRLPTGQPVSVVCDVRLARTIAEAVAEDEALRSLHGHSHVRASFEHWQIVGQN